MSPWATVVITSYNYAEYLGQCIDSALQQTYPRTEVIVVDDGSRDNSPAIIRSYGDRIKSLLREENRGQASSFNSGFAMSSGEVVCFLDSDDMLLPTAMERAVESLADASAAMVHWPLAVVDTHGKPLGRVTPRRPLAEGNLRDTLLRFGPNCYVWAPTSGEAWARSFLEAVLPMPERDYWTFCDSYLTTLVPLYGTIKRIAEPQTHYRLHGGGIHTKITLEQTLDVAARDCLELEKCIKRMNIEADAQRWDLRVWERQIRLALRDIEMQIPAGETFILVDEDNWGTHGSVGGRRALPFPERQGVFAGCPADDKAALEEFERSRVNGACAIVFAPQCLWWLEYYAGFHQYLRSHYGCMVENDHIAMFDLRRPLT